MGFWGWRKIFRRKVKRLRIMYHSAQEVQADWEWRKKRALLKQASSHMHAYDISVCMHGSASAGASTNTYTPSNAGAGGIKGGVAPLPRGWTPFFDEAVNRQRGLKTGVPYAYHN